MHTKFLSQNAKERDHAEELGVDRKIILEWNLGQLGGKVETRCMWLRTGTGRGAVTNTVMNLRIP
jgi:hypothetical protein